MWMGAIELALDGDAEPASAAARTTPSEAEVFIFCAPSLDEAVGPLSRQG